jgi:hypothetical protein
MNFLLRFAAYSCLHHASYKDEEYFLFSTAQKNAQIIINFIFVVFEKVIRLKINVHTFGMGRSEKFIMQK